MPLYPTSGLPGYLRDQALLPGQRGRFGQLACEQFVVGEEVERELQLDQRAGVAGEPDLAPGQCESGREVPDFGGDDARDAVAGQPEHAAGVAGPDVQGARGIERSGQ